MISVCPVFGIMSYLTELGNIDQPSQVLQVRTFIVESPEVKVLRVVSRTERIQDFRGFELCVHRQLICFAPFTETTTHFGTWHASCL